MTGLPTGITPVADPVNPDDYYAIDSSTGVLYRSTDGGETFSQAATGLTAASNDQLLAVSGHAGELYFAAQTGGRYWQPQELSGLAAAIPYSEAGITVRDLKELWNMPAVFLAILALKMGEWLLRRRWGIV